MIAFAQLSLLARDREDYEQAEALAAQALAVAARAELLGCPSYALALAASAHAALRHGRWAEARELVSAAEPLGAGITEALPWLAVAARVELGRCYVILRDAQAAGRVAAELAALCRARPLLGVLTSQARALLDEAERLGQPHTAKAGLTPAEQRLLPLLATYLSFREIAERLGVSRNTVKTQAISVYRKLGVSGRSDAMAAAAAFDLARAG
jgi:LuxR family maltose regulon positive regulatory protein